MDDRTMLELAAKAAGLYTADDISDCWTDTNTGEEGEPLYPPFGFVTLSGVWNPLLDDGDALRLLAELPSLWSLSLQFGQPHIKMHVLWGIGPGIVVNEGCGEGRHRSEAIRRAITRAAAEIQLAKESGK